MIVLITVMNRQNYVQLIKQIVHLLNLNAITKHVFRLNQFAIMLEIVPIIVMNMDAV